MKRQILFLLTLPFLFTLGSCSDDNDIKTDSNNNIPIEVRKDIETRFSKSEIKYTSTSDGLVRVHLIDENNNEAELSYENNNFLNEYRIIPDLSRLPEKIQRAFYQVQPSGTINDLQIYRIQRNYLKHDLYMFKFLATTSNVTNLVYNIFINEDGTLLYTLNHNINDFIMLYPNYMAEFEYVKKNYSGADVRCQLNEASEPLLIITHEGYTKYVFFKNIYNSIDDKYKNAWKETRYKLPSNYPVPANVLASLKEEHPDFVYTKITKIEGPDFESYMLTDETREDKLGYTIPNNK